MYQRIVNDITLYKTKLVLEMAEIKLAAFLFGSIFYPLYLWGIIGDFGDFKSLVLMLFLIVTGGIKFYRWTLRDNLNRKRLNFENQMKELDVREKEISVRERELNIMEREDEYIRNR